MDRSRTETHPSSFIEGGTSTPTRVVFVSNQRTALCIDAVTGQ